MRRRTLLRWAASLGAVGLAGEGVRAEAPLYFPPGSRLGFRKPDLLEPRTRDPRNLLAVDHTFQVMIAEPAVLGEPYDGNVWNQSLHRDAKLISATFTSVTEQRRLFELGYSAGDPDHSWRTLVVRTTDALGQPEWFGELTLTTQPLNQKIGQRARWQGEIDAILASVTVRPALSVADMLREHGIGMDLFGLHPHHFGSKLVASLRPPRTLAERWTNDSYISMAAPPTPMPEAEEVRQAYAGMRRTLLAQGATGWTSNGIDWIAEIEKPLASTGVHVREMQGFGAKRMIQLRSFCRDANRAEIGAALERVARSVTLTP